MQFKNILAAGAGLAATSVSAAVGESALAQTFLPIWLTLLARDDAAVIVHEVVTYSPSVVYSTRVQTVTECGADVTDCPDITGVLTSVIDSTTTICPVTATAIMSTSGVPNPSNSGPLQTVTITFTNSSTAWASTETAPAQASSVALGGWSSSGAPFSSKQPGATLASPEEASKTETASAAKSTSFVYATITLPATASSSTSGPSSSASGPSSSASGPSSSANSVSLLTSLTPMPRISDTFLDCSDHYSSFDLLDQRGRSSRWHWRRKRHFQLLGQWHPGNCKYSTRSRSCLNEFGSPRLALLTKYT